RVDRRPLTSEERPRRGLPLGRHELERCGRAAAAAGWGLRAQRRRGANSERRLGGGLVSLVGRAPFARAALGRSALVTSRRAGNRGERDRGRPGKPAGLGGRWKLSRQTARARQCPSLPLLSHVVAGPVGRATQPKGWSTALRLSAKLGAHRLCARAS